MNLLRSPQPRAGERAEAHLGARLRILSGSGSHRQYPDDPRASKGHRARPDQLRARLQIGARFYMAPVGARRLWLGPDAQVAARERSSGTPRIAPHARGTTYRDPDAPAICRNHPPSTEPARKSAGVGVNEGSPKFLCGKGELRCGLWDNLVIGSCIDSLVVFFRFYGLGVPAEASRSARVSKNVCQGNLTLVGILSSARMIRPCANAGVQ